MQYSRLESTTDTYQYQKREERNKKPWCLGKHDDADSVNLPGCNGGTVISMVSRNTGFDMYINVERSETQMDPYAWQFAMLVAG